MHDSQKNLYKKILGRAGENRAVKHLKKLGYEIVERNCVLRSGEADVIAKTDGILVFVEVKTRTGDAFGEPCEAVDFRKQKKYVRICEEYLQRQNLQDVICRFDVVEVKNGKINHIMNAFGV